VNYTRVDTYSNGNQDHLECGIISSGPCAGDTLWGIGLYEANDQHGCCTKGMTSIRALSRQIEIRGKCESRCSLGSSVLRFNSPVNNYGMDRSNLDELIDDNDKLDNETETGL